MADEIYNSSFTGAQIDEAISDVRTNKDTWNNTATKADDNATAIRALGTSTENRFTELGEDISNNATAISSLSGTVNSHTTDISALQLGVQANQLAIRQNTEAIEKIGNVIKPCIKVSVESGATVTVTGENETFETVSDGNDVEFEVSNYGNYTVSATKNGKSSNIVEVKVDTVQIYEVSLTFFASTITVTVDSGSTVTCEGAGKTQILTSTGTVVFTVYSVGTYKITATLDGDSAEGTVEITEYGQAETLKLVYCHIYGVLWDGTSTTTWSRTDEAEGFVNPIPAISGGTGSSPFDELMPWAGMVRVTDATAGELVAIPKFWYKWTRSGTTMKLQIATEALDGYYVSPAHADRGDGSGERDIVYVGRYHCNSSYKSVTGASPKVNITRATARSDISALGDAYWQFDYAMLWTIQMLYLVEYGDWNSQNTIGYGCGNGSGTQNVGSSDSMQYHTGTMQSSRTAYGVGCQYRYIEDLWGNVFGWVDGIYFSSSNVYCINNPSNFSDTTNGTKVSTRPTSSNYISAWSTPTASGFEWALYPSAVSGSSSTYVCDYCGYVSSGVVLYCGGFYVQNQDYGLFFLVGSNSASDSNSVIGCRLQKLP